jgi:methylenetetrahydrofolate--tRNA-(uracil-5-)-methyltransferase
MTTNNSVAVIGAGIAGAEAALVLARQGIAVDLFEMRPDRMTPAHSTALPAELICSNSLKSQTLPGAHGLLKEELSILGSPLLALARAHAVPAGSALAVDRLKFSNAVLEKISATHGITFIRKELSSPPEGYAACIIAAGPLVSDALALWLQQEFSAASLNFYDAIAPIVSFDSVDMTIAFFASRNEEGSGDYLNCPFTEEEYRIFLAALREADRTVARSFENARFFEACLPVEVMAERGDLALAYGPLKPIGITDPKTGRWPFAVCQLRRETESGESYNMVGFQTRLTIPEQRRVFRLIPGLANAEFLRHGSIHRNTYLDSPRLLSADLSFKVRPDLFLAGQLCGNEGYTESIATGHLAALFLGARLRSINLPAPPRETALGSMLNHVTASKEPSFTPSNIHFGLLPPMPDNSKRIRKRANREMMCERALASMREWAGKGRQESSNQ